METCQRIGDKHVSFSLAHHVQKK